MRPRRWKKKNRLAALMSELSQGVLVCNIEGRILLYNDNGHAKFSVLPPTRATAVLARWSVSGRSIFALVDRSLLTHALEGVQARLEKDQPDPNVQFVIGTRTGQLVRAQLAPVLAAGLPSCGSGSSDRWVRDDLGKHHSRLRSDTTRDMLLHSFTEGSRAALASIRAAVET